MSLLAQAQELKVESKSAVPQQATKVMTIDINQLVAFAGACEAQFPKLSLNENAIQNGGLASPSRSPLATSASWAATAVATTTSLSRSRLKKLSTSHNPPV